MRHSTTYLLLLGTVAANRSPIALWRWESARTFRARVRCNMTSYQILLAANGAESRVQTLHKTILLRLKDLGVESGAVSFFDDTTISSRDHKAPTVGAFLSTAKNPTRRAGISELVQAGVMVVPVVENLSRFNDFVFDELRGINGMELQADDQDMERIAAVLLEGLNLLRKSRRLFISYKRSETQGVAIQLYEALDRNGFDVFLDTLSIRPGEQFQDVLWHRLADTDVIVLLGSPGFLASRWTTKELAAANSTNIQVLHLLWPGNQLNANAAFSRAMPVESKDFQSSSVTLGPEARLKDSVVEKAVVQAESLRARALAARHSYLVEEFCAEARHIGLTPHVQPERFITVESNSGRFVAAVPAVGVPDAVRYHEIEDELSKHPKQHSEVILLYDERGIQEKWLKHLAWLDSHKLKVRSVQVAQCASWLRSL
jgi:TIR domain